MTLAINDADVRALARMDRMIEAIEHAVLEEHDGEVIMPPRSNLMHEGGFLRVMPTYLCRSGVFGYKSFHGSLAHGVRYLVVLCREEDGEILALLDAALLTALRTGATSGLATKYMAQEGSASVGLIGSGLEATTNLAAVAAVRDIDRVWVYSRNSERRNDFARRTSDSMGVEIVATDSPEDAVRDASIVIAATNTGNKGPVALHGRWLQKGQHVVSIGATSPFLREIDPEAFDRADEVVFDAPVQQVFEESGDLIAVDGVLRDRLFASSKGLADVVAEGRLIRSPDQITLFKSVGTAAQDIASAMAIYELAVEQGRGRELGELAAPKFF